MLGFDNTEQEFLLIFAMSFFCSDNLTKLSGGFCPPNLIY